MHRTHLLALALVAATSLASGCSSSSEPTRRVQLNLTGTVSSAVDGMPIPDANVQLRSGGSTCIPVLESIALADSPEGAWRQEAALATLVPIPLLRTPAALRYGPVCTTLGTTQTDGSGRYTIVYAHEYRAGASCSEGLVLSASSPDFVGKHTSEGAIRCIDTPQTFNIELDVIASVAVSPSAIQLAPGSAFQFSTQITSSRGESVAGGA